LKSYISEAKFSYAVDANLVAYESKQLLVQAVRS